MERRRLVIPTIATTFSFASLLLLLCTRRASSSDEAHPSARAVALVNRGGVHAAMHWIHPDTGQTVPILDHVVSGEETRFNSFVGHRFEFRELPDVDSGTCGGGEGVCRVGTFTVNAHQDQVVTLADGFRVLHDARFHEVRQPTVDEPRSPGVTAGDDAGEPQAAPLSYCQERARDAIRGAAAASDGVSPDLAARTLADLVACVESNVTRELRDMNEEVKFQAESRVTMSSALENYTCADARLPTTAPLSTTTWEHDGVVRDVNVLLERERSRVHAIKNFISEEECRAIEDAAAPILHKATVADGKGGSQYSENRKAMQAGIKVPWDKEAEGHPIARLSRRVYDYANHILGLDLNEDGQEDLMSIQYFGRGEDDAEPDRYTPHCDGDCTGLKHRRSGRVATMVMYCKVPERGGATNFQNAGIHVNPELGTGTFFSSIGPRDLVMDNGFTQHSGCPVVEGEKKIAVQWLRLGVDKENPWDSFNTLGVKPEDCD